MSNLNIPAGLPSLAKGAHSPTEGVACVMEYVSVLAGEMWSDSPSCTHPLLAAVARNVNDSIGDDEERARILVPLIGRLLNSNDPSVTPHLLLWTLERVGKRIGFPHRRAYEYLRKMLLADAPLRHFQAPTHLDSAEGFFAHALAYSYSCASQVRENIEVYPALTCVGQSAHCCFALSTNSTGVRLLTEMLDTYDWLSERQPVEVPVERLQRLRVLVEAGAE